MKCPSKTVSLFLALGLTTTLAGCGGGQPDKVEGETEQPTQEQPARPQDEGGEGGEGG